MTNSEISTGLKIRSLRQKQHKSQAEIAQQLNISIPAFSKIETGITDINLSRFCQIAELFEVSPGSLLPGVDNMEAVIEKYQRYEEKIAGLQSQIVRLQAKLINAYEEVEQMKTKTNKLNQE